jgi:hypothetical protein
MTDPKQLQEWINLDDLGIQLSESVVAGSDVLAEIGVTAESKADTAKSDAKGRNSAA